ncbi:hypothetical protein BDW60DRAFT_179215 [Aspergillus nidulans var. acristatus]
MKRIMSLTSFILLIRKQVALLEAASGLSSTIIHFQMALNQLHAPGTLRAPNMLNTPVVSSARHSFRGNVGFRGRMLVCDLLPTDPSGFTNIKDLSEV